VQPDVATMWLALLKLLGKVVGEQHPQLRDRGLHLLQRWLFICSSSPPPQYTQYVPH